MDFYEVLDKVIELLHRHSRLTYRALKLQFKMNDETLEALKDELLFSQPVVDEDGRGLVWTGEIDPSPDSDVQSEADAEVRFNTLLQATIGLLWSQKRVTYRELKHTFDIDGVLLEEIREELLFKQLVIDDEDKGLVWMGEPQSIAPSAVSIPPQPAAAKAMSTEAQQDDLAISPAPIRNASEAERRQLTVMFCDLADSTKLSQQLDPEDLREVVRAYQATTAEVIHQYEGHIAQYLGDGLLVYFGWPVAHEDDAQRALHAGLGIVDAIMTTLNANLKRDKNIQLTVRLGIHSGPVVVGEMGGGGRHENLATGETVNIASRLEGLAVPNTVVISAVSARLVRDAFALEDLGIHALKGVAEPMQMFRVLGPLEIHEDETAAVGVPFLVGRDEEVGLLIRRWEQSKEGMGQVVLISGEAGIGKSSLVETIRAHVLQEGLTRITFRCSTYHTATDRQMRPCTGRRLMHRPLASRRAPPTPRRSPCGRSADGTRSVYHARRLPVPLHSR
jgi:class 3 adenylate cyclase